MQYLITPDQNGRLKQVFNGLFPPLHPDEALLEFLFTREEFRSSAVMPTAVTRVLEIARQRGFRRVVTYVSTVRTDLIRFYAMLGFSPFVVRRERRRMFTRRVLFTPDGDDVLGQLGPVRAPDALVASEPALGTTRVPPSSPPSPAS
jgi:GNAT superfamily N-acetyltransferase